MQSLRTFSNIILPLFIFLFLIVRRYYWLKSTWFEKDKIGTNWLKNWRPTISELTYLLDSSFTVNEIDLHFVSSLTATYWNQREIIYYLNFCLLLTLITIRYKKLIWREFKNSYILETQYIRFIYSNMTTNCLLSS